MTFYIGGALCARTIRSQIDFKCGTSTCPNSLSYLHGKRFKCVRLFKLLNRRVRSTGSISRRRKQPNSEMHGRDSWKNKTRQNKKEKKKCDLFFFWLRLDSRHKCPLGFVRVHKVKRHAFGDSTRPALRVAFTTRCVFAKSRLRHAQHSTVAKVFAGHGPIHSVIHAPCLDHGSGVDVCVKSSG